jgi:hypothetical protein
MASGGGGRLASCSEPETRPAGPLRCLPAGRASGLWPRQAGSGAGELAIGGSGVAEAGGALSGRTGESCKKGGGEIPERYGAGGDLGEGEAELSKNNNCGWNFLERVGKLLSLGFSFP